MSISKRKKRGNEKFEQVSFQNEDERRKKLQEDIIQSLSQDSLIKFFPLSFKAQENIQMWEELGNDFDLIKDSIIAYTEPFSLNLRNPLYSAISKIGKQELRLVFVKFFGDIQSTASTMKWEIVYKFLGLTTPLEKRKNEADNIESFSGNLEEGIEFVEMKDNIIPSDLSKLILSYLPRNYDTLVNVGGTCRLYYLILLQSFDNISVTRKNVHNISLLSLKHTRRITICKGMTMKGQPHIWKNVDPQKLQTIIIDSESHSFAKGCFNKIKENGVCFPNVTEIISYGGFPHSVYGITERGYMRGMKFYSYKKLPKGKEFDYDKFFPNLRCIRGAKELDDYKFPELLKLRELDFFSTELFRCYEPKEKGEVFQDLDEEYRDRRFEMDPWLFGTGKFKNITKLRFSSLNSLCYDIENRQILFADNSLLIHNNKIHFIFEVFPNVKVLELDLYCRYCHCGKDVFFSLRRMMTTKSNRRLEKFVIHNYPGFFPQKMKQGMFGRVAYRGDYHKRRQIVHFCNKNRTADGIQQQSWQPYPQNLDVKEICFYSSCDHDDTNKDYERYVTVDLFNLELLLEHQFFENNKSIEIFRCEIPFSKGYLRKNHPSNYAKQGWRNFSPIGSRKGEEHELSTSKIVGKFCTFLESSITDFKILDLIIRTRDKDYAKESIRIKYCKLPNGINRLLFRYYYKDDEEKIIRDSQWDIPPENNNVGEKFYLDVLKRERYDKPLRICSLLFVNQVLHKLVKKRRMMLDEIEIVLGNDKDHIWKDFVKSCARKIKDCDVSNFDKDGVIYVK